MISYAEALISLDKTYQFICAGYEYEGIDWLDERPLPTKEILDEEIIRLRNIAEKTQYQRRRENFYPSWQILADAIYHQQKGDDSKMQEYIRLCDEIKNKYPKFGD